MEIIEDKGKKYLQWAENGQFKKKKLSKEALELITDSRGKLKPRQYIETLAKNDFKPQKYSRYRKLKIVRSNAVRDDIRKNKVEELKIRRQKLMEKKEKTPQEEREIKIIDSAIQQYNSGNTEIIDSVIQNLNTNLANINVSDEALRDIAKKASFRLFSEETEKKMKEEFDKNLKEKIDSINAKYDDDLVEINKIIEDLIESKNKLKNQADRDEAEKEIMEATETGIGIGKRKNEELERTYMETFEEERKKLFDELVSTNDILKDDVKTLTNEKDREIAKNNVMAVLSNKLCLATVSRSDTNKSFSDVEALNKFMNWYPSTAAFNLVANDITTYWNIALCLRSITDIEDIIFVFVWSNSKPVVGNSNVWFVSASDLNDYKASCFNSSDSKSSARYWVMINGDTNILFDSVNELNEIPSDAIGISVNAQTALSKSKGVFYIDSLMNKALGKFRHQINMSVIYSNIINSNASGIDVNNLSCKNFPEIDKLMVWSKKFEKFDMQTIIEEVMESDVINYAKDKLDESVGDHTVEEFDFKNPADKDETEELINIEPVAEDATTTTTKEASEGFKSSCGSVLKDLMDDMKKYNVGFKMYISENKYYKKRVEQKK